MLKRYKIILFSSSLLLMSAFLTNCTLISKPVLESSSTPIIDIPVYSSTPDLDQKTSEPDFGQYPPGYRVESPEFTHKILDLPQAHLGQQLILDWNYKTSAFEYLTFSGDKGKLVQINGLSETRDLYSSVFPPYMGDDQHTLYFILTKELDISCGEENLTEYRFYFFDLWEDRSWGFAFQALDHAGANWSLGDDFFVMSNFSFCEEEPNQYNYFISRTDPFQVTRVEKPLGWNLNLLHDQDRLLGWTRSRYCIWDPPIDSKQPICSELTGGDELNMGYFGGGGLTGLPSPDGKWLEVRIGGSQPDNIGLVPFTCLENSTIDCLPIWLEVGKISADWDKDCQQIASTGLWTPDSQQLLLMLEPKDQMVPTNCTQGWQEYELWSYDLSTDTLHLIKKYPLENSPIHFLHWYDYHIPPKPVWSADGNYLLLDSSDNIYRASLDDGELTPLGEMSTNPFGVVIIPEDGSTLADKTPEPSDDNLGVIDLPHRYCGSSGPLSNLAVDMRAVVNPDYPSPNQVRGDAGKGNWIVGEIPSGQEVLVLFGPRCVDGYTWWYVEAEDMDLFGWTADGDGLKDWLVPIKQ